MEALIFAGIGLLALAVALVLAQVQARKGNLQGWRVLREYGIGLMAAFALLVLLGAVTEYWKGIGGLIASSAILTGFLSFVIAGAAWSIRKASLGRGRMRLLVFAGETLLWASVLLSFAAGLLDRVKESGWAVALALVGAWLFAPVLYGCCFKEAEPEEQPTPALQPH